MRRERGPWIHWRHRWILSLGWVAALGGMASGQVTVLTNPSQFSGTEAIITFDTLGNSVVVNNQFEPFGLQGVRFSVNAGTNPITVTESNARQFPPAGTRALANTGVPGNNIILTFNAMMNRVAFEIRPLSLADDLNLTLRCTCGGAPIATQFFVVGTSYRWVGLESVVPFDQVEIDVTNATTGAFRMDNLRFEGPPVCKIASPIHESSTFAPCPIGFSCATSIFDQQYLGSRFEVKQAVNVTAVGGHLSGTGFANQKIFAAIISLAGPTALPIGNPFDPGELVASTIFDPGRPGSDVRTALAATLAPGWYALVFGSGLFGATGDAGLEATGTPLPGNSILLWNDQGSGFVWQDVGAYGVRFVVETDTVYAQGNGLASTTMLDGTGSKNPEPGQLVTYSWSTTCAGFGLDDASSPTPLLTVDTPALCPSGLACSVALTVSDGVTSDSCSLPIQYDDTTAPSLTVPADVSLNCSGSTDPSNTGTATAVDNYDASPAVGYSDVSTPGSCGSEVTITRTWTATDDCGNSSEGEQSIAVVDGQNPTISCPANALGLECPADTGVAARGSATAQDNCGSAGVSSSDVSTPGCGNTESITRTWTATDGCGLIATCDQTIATVDTTPPTITVNTSPISVVDVNCSGSEAVAVPSGSGNDGCDGIVPVTHDAPALFPAGVTTTVTYSASDACGNDASAEKDVTVRHGAHIQVTASLFTVGLGHHPGVTKEPLDGILVGAYRNQSGSCARDKLNGNWGLLIFAVDDIVADCTPEATAVTDSDGFALLDVPPGDFVVASHFDTDEDNLPDQYLYDRVNNLSCGETETARLLMIRVAHGRNVPCKFHRMTGSELIIVEPDEVVWDGTEQLYPFVFDTVGDWGVTVTVAPPEGFEADYEALSDEVINEVSAVQFTITEVGSDLVPTKTAFKVRHNGETRTVRSSIRIRMTPDYARSRGFDPDVLRTRGILAEPERPVRRTPVK